MEARSSIEDEWHMSGRPPIWPFKFLKWFCPDHLYEEIEGDLIQKFDRDVKTFGERKARRRLIWNVARFFRPGIVLRNKFSVDIINSYMLLSYIKIALRSFTKRKVFSVINIFGLSIGFSVCLVLLKYVEFESSFDRYHEKANQIYRTISTYYVNGERKGTFPLSDFGQGPALLAEIPEIKNYVRTHLMHGGAILSNNENPAKRIQFHEEESIQFVDTTFFEIFSYQAIEGNLQTALDEPNSIVLTESAAQKYFGKEQQIVGRVLNVSGSWWVNGEYTVTAVIKDVPSTSHFKFHFLISTHNLLQNEFYKGRSGTSTEGNFVTYIELNSGSDIKSVQRKIPDVITKYLGKELVAQETKASLALQPLTDIHLSPGFTLEMSPTISVNTLYFFTLISLLIIALAWINYVNLSTAGATERGKEVGIKKAIGVHRYQLISQFMTESFLIHIVSAAVAIGLTTLLLPAVGEILDKDLIIDYADPKVWIVVMGFVFIGSFVAGAYPSFVLSSFRPLEIIKGIRSKTSGTFSLRQTLVVIQFSVSIVILAGTLAVTRQLHFMENQSKGFTSEKILIIKGPGTLDDRHIENSLISLKDELKNLSFVKSVATSDAIPGGGYNWGTGMRKSNAGEEENRNGEVAFVDPDFIDTYNMTLLSGNVWNDEMSFQRRSILLNEIAVKRFGFPDAERAIGEKLIIGGDSFEIKGVLKDYHWSSLKSPISPFVLASNKISGRYLSIQIESADMNESISQIEKLHQTAFPEIPFEYYFLDDFFNKQYQDDQQFHDVVGLFAILSIVVASLGLWGLASFTIAQRTKEISIRKVMGASVQNILTLLTSNFFKLLMIASVIALPVVVYGIDWWLEKFAYKINPSWDLYVLPTIVLFVVSLSTIMVKTIRAALINPADNLRTE